MANPEAQALLRIARRDLKAAEVLQIPSIDESSWGFQIQQAVEKSLKAWLFSLGEEPPLIHNLTALLERVADAGGDVEPFLALEAFTVFAVQFRYDAEPEPMELDRRDWQQRAVELVHQLGVASECIKSWLSLRLWLDPIGLLGGVDQQAVQQLLAADQQVGHPASRQLWFGYRISAR